MPVNEFEVPIIVKHTLKDLRVRAGYSQSTAAAKLGIAEPTLRTWERDSSDISYSMIQKIVKLYGIPQDYIFFGSANAFSEKIIFKRK